MKHKLALSPKQRSTHTYVIGQSGTGKSRALESWIMQDILAGHGVGLIDPHGDLFDSLILRLASLPKVWKRVVIINPFDQRWTISINPLEPIKGIPLERTAAFMTDVMMKIWKLNTTNAPRMLWLVTNTFLALTDLGMTLLDLPKFLQDADFRNHLLPRLRHERARDYFQREFPKEKSSVNQWISPVLNKIGALIFDPDIRPMLVGGNTLNFRKVLDDRKVLLVNLSKGQLGEAASSLLGAFIIARIQSIALSRANTQYRPPFYLYMDEFQNYTTDNIKVILTESRKYGLSITFAHQYLDQLSQDIRSAVLNTAGTLACFRVSYQDAHKLSKEIFSNPNQLNRTIPQLTVTHKDLWPRLKIDFQKKSANRELLTQILSSLKQREFWVKRRGTKTPTKHRSYDMPDVKITREIKIKRFKMIETSGQRYGILKHEALKNISGQKTKTSRTGSKTSKLPPKEGIPFWGD